MPSSFFVFSARQARNTLVRTVALVALSLPGLAGAADPPRVDAVVKTVFEDGTIVLKLGSSLVPVRLDGVMLFPGATAAIRQALPDGVKIRVQVTRKGNPAMVRVWRTGQQLQDLLIAKKLAKATAPVPTAP